MKHFKSFVSFLKEVDMTQEVKENKLSIVLVPSIYDNKVMIFKLV